MLSRIASELENSKKIAVFTHISPDGDALGSSLALMHALISLGKECAVFCADPVPEKYAFLPGSGEIKLRFDAGLKFDISVSVDAADVSRLGFLKDAFFSSPKTICLDHHGTNPLFADMNIVEPECASTAEVVLKLINSLGVHIADEAALCLFVGISTDTFHFSFSNTKSETLLAASKVVPGGVNMDELTGRLYRFRSLAKTRMIGQILSGLRVFSGGRIVLMTSTLEQRLGCGARDEDYEGIINYGIESYGVEIAILGRVMNEKGEMKFSFRSKGEIDVASLAAKFGGGGHMNAAGCNIKTGDFDETAKMVVESAIKFLADMQ